MNIGFRIAGTAPGNWHPPSAELSDCGLNTESRRETCVQLAAPTPAGRPCKTKAISGCWPGAGCTNKANSGPPAGRDLGTRDVGLLYKQTQFLPAGKSVGQAGTPNAVRRVWEPDPPCRWVQLRQTKPISERVLRRKCQVSGRRSQRPGLQAFCTGDACVAPTTEPHTAAEPPRQMRQTKPISGGAKRGAKPWRERGYGE